MRIAIYPGSFDPVTCGHLDIISRAAAMFDQLIVLVAVNSAKSPVFDAAERTEILRRTCADFANVEIEKFADGLLVDYAMSRKATAIVKGLRAVSDFESEFQMALLNRHLQPAVETVFLMTSAEFSYLSSSIIKEIAHLGGDVRGLVPDAALPFLARKFAAP